MQGQGFPLVMIMGLSGNADWWDPRMIEALSKNFKLVLFDNRGAGRTNDSSRECTIKLLADDTKGLMDTLGISTAHVLGISMGGMIAQELVLNHPKKVRKLVLCSTNCGHKRAVPPTDKVIALLTAERGGLSQEEVARRSLPLLFTEDFRRNNSAFIELAIQQFTRAPISSQAFMRHLTAIMNFDSHNRLPQIKASTLVLHGKHDVLVPPENAPILAEAIPNAKLVYFEKSAHGLVEEMESLISVLVDFLV